MKRLFILVLVAATLLSGCPGDNGGGEAEAKGFTVTYDANGGAIGEVPVDTGRYQANAEVVLKDPGTLGIEDGEFKGWFLYKFPSLKYYVADERLQEGSVYQADGDLVFYAVWKPNDKEEADWVWCTNTGPAFHKYSCSRYATYKDSGKYSLKREETVENGQPPCTICNP